jgi:NAD(P)-dependent dehydrogenase (short-subunit alcohol dehydrogenase family)
MRIDLTGKRAIVSGSTEGIGFAIAGGLLRAGAEVVINGRNEAKVKAALARLGTGATAVIADLSTAEGMRVLRNSVPQADVVVSNLGLSERCEFLDTDDAMWDRAWQVNVMSGVRLAREYVPGMLAAGWGRVLFISSESAFNIPTEMIHYGICKSAVSALARGLAKSLAGTAVTANSVLVGPTLTEGVKAIVAKNFQQPGQTVESAMSDALAKFRPSTILRRGSTPEEIANMIVYLASPQASSTTGAAVRVDGGVIDTVM